MSLFLNDGFIGYKPYDVSSYAGSDSAENYEKLLKSKPSDWYYKDLPIEYSLNMKGHRSKDVAYLNLKDYILFLGCSQTFGVGNRLEDTYPFLLSQKLNCDYYNLAIGGAGSDTAYHNLNMWLTKFQNHMPKLIVWQWIYSGRFLGRLDTNRYDVFTPFGAWIGKTNVDKILVLQEEFSIFDTRDILISEFLKHLNKKIPVIELSPLEFRAPVTGEQKLRTVEFFAIDGARDEAHYGFETNKLLVEEISSKFKENHHIWIGSYA